MKNNFVACEERPYPDEYLLVELDCDTGRARSRNSIVKRKFNHFFRRGADLFGRLNDYNPDDTKVYPDGKYRHYWRVKRSGTEEVYTLYCCYFEWRIGGNDRGAHLGELMELLDPEMYAGFAAKSFEQITWRPIDTEPVRKSAGSDLDLPF